MDNNTELILPALRVHMGDWIYYVTFLGMEQIADRIEFAEDIHSSPTLKMLIQREITNRSQDISDYLVNQPQRFFNSLIVGVYGGSPNWQEFKISTNSEFDAELLPLHLEGSLGILRLSGEETLFAIDGQHRVQGIKKALEENIELKREEVSVIFVSHRNDPTGMERTRRLFTTLNRYAKPVSKSEIIALDEDDIIAITTRELVERHPLFQEKISLSKTKAVSVNDNRSFTTIITLYDVLEILFKRSKGWTDTKRHRPDDNTIKEYYDNSERFWDTLVKYFPPLDEILTSQPENNRAGRFRNREGGHLLFRPVGLLIIAQVVRLAKDSGLSQEESIKRISKVSMELTDEPWVGLLWDKTNKRMISGTTPQKFAKQLLFYIIGGDLSDIKTSLKKVRREYAGLLNKEESQVKLPRLYTSFPPK
ncbi:MAG: DGQHR domain-containing protein [Candidatus Poribacteria bacterium]|nr:DGQHR domain-containing protein [Candidatus Poribacteria bacterium]